MVSRQNYRYSVHPAKIEIDFRLVTLKIRKYNATKNSQVVIKVSTQNTMKENNSIVLLTILNDKNYCIKFTEKPKCIEMEIRNEQPTWISTSHKQLRNSPRKKNNKIPPKSHSLSQAKMVSCLQLQSTTL